MITPDSPDRQYSSRLRTAVVLTGSGTGGAYHAGVLRALHEAGVRIDLVAGRGIGAVGAMFAAIDGGARLWDENGIWKGSHVRDFYGWRPSLRVAAWACAAAAVILAIPLMLLALAVLIGVAGLLLTLIGLESAGGTLGSGYSRWIETLFAPAMLPTIVPRLVLLALLVALGALTARAVRRHVGRRRARRVGHGLAGHLLAGPLSAAGLVTRCTSELWNLIRGAAPIAVPAPVELGRRYLELLSENLDQPGFRELLIVTHDVDARRDLVFALLAARHRSRFFARPAAGRQGEAFDLGGAARDHAMDMLTASVALPVATEPHLVTFAPEGPWRGETHRVCDRPAALARVIEEVTAAGAEQLVIVSATSPPVGVHALSAGRADLRGLATEPLVTFEGAALRDVLEQCTGRFAGLYVIRPAHNPVGPLDFGGVYDERSDRLHTLEELVDRGYDDAYRQFIEPIVGASGERIETVQ